ncbi:MAG: recombinase family protein, partial [Candidatus Fimimonas sp.]
MDKKYIVNEYESKIVEDAFLMYSQGYKAVAIAEKFKECGYRRKNGKLIDHKYLYFILHNKRYTGVVEHQGELYDNIYPRIKSDDLWEKVNSINEENKLAPSRKKEIFDYILSGKLVCGDCKHKMGGESGTSHTGDIHYYYICLSRRKKRAKCNTKPVQKQWLEDTVINATTQMLSSVNNVKVIAQNIFEVHKKETADNTALKLIERKRAEAVKAQNNIIRAIEKGIITDATKSRLTELEAQIAQFDIEINKEKARSYTFLTADDIEMYLSKFVFESPDDIKVRKLIVNTFIREVILYDDEIVITYNFTDNPERLKITKEQTIQTEKEIETADKSAFSSLTGSYKLRPTAP